SRGSLALAQVVALIPLAMNRTLPSPRAQFRPPGCADWARFGSQVCTKSGCTWNIRAGGNPRIAPLFVPRFTPGRQMLLESAHRLPHKTAVLPEFPHVPYTSAKKMVFDRPSVIVANVLWP